MAHCTSGAIRGSVPCSRTLRQGIELATFWLLNDFSTSCTTVRQSGDHVYFARTCALSLQVRRNRIEHASLPHKLANREFFQEPPLASCLVTPRHTLCRYAGPKPWTIWNVSNFMSWPGPFTPMTGCWGVAFMALLKCSATVWRWGSGQTYG